MDHARGGEPSVVVAPRGVERQARALRSVGTQSAAVGPARQHRGTSQSDGGAEGVDEQGAVEWAVRSRSSTRRRRRAHGRRGSCRVCAAPGSSATRVIERFQKSSWSEIARTAAEGLEQRDVTNAGVDRPRTGRSAGRSSSGSTVLWTSRATAPAEAAPGRQQRQSEHDGRADPGSPGGEHGDRRHQSDGGRPPRWLRPPARPACRSASRRRTGSASRRPWSRAHSRSAAFGPRRARARRRARDGERAAASRERRRGRSRGRARGTA